jgi:hypothetical protein
MEQERCGFNLKKGAAFHFISGKALTALDTNTEVCKVIPKARSYNDRKGNMEFC